MIFALACATEPAPTPAPPPPGPGPVAQVMQHHDTPPPAEPSTCAFATPPLEGLAAATGPGWALPARVAADQAPLPAETMVVLARAEGAADSELLVVACEAWSGTARVPGSRQWLVHRDAAGATVWSARVGRVEADGVEWWERVRVGWSADLLGAVELSGRYEDRSPAGAVWGSATAYVAPGPDAALAPDPACPFQRPFRADTSRRLLVLDDVRVAATATEPREARLRMTLTADASQRIDERWNWPKGTPVFGEVVAQPKEESFSRRVEWKGEAGGFVHVCPSSMPPGSVRSG